MLQRAIELSRQVVDAFGADAALKADATRALLRLGSVCRWNTFGVPGVAIAIYCAPMSDLSRRAS